MKISFICWENLYLIRCLHLIYQRLKYKGWSKAFLVWLFSRAYLTLSHPGVPCEQSIDQGSKTMGLGSWVKPNKNNKEKSFLYFTPQPILCFAHCPIEFKIEQCTFQALKLHAMCIFWVMMLHFLMEWHMLFAWPRAKWSCF